MLRWVPACLPVVLLAATLLTTPTARAQTTWYADDDADPNGDGASWASPFQDLQDALDVAIAGDEIRVAGGKYVPSQQTDPNDPRAATFQLINGVKLYGGHAGLADPNNPDERDIELYEAILSGDINGDDDPNDFPNGPSCGENCYHVFYHPAGLNLDATAVLDGFTITAGNAHGSSPYERGAGMCNDGSSPTVANCAFRENSAMYGGGMCNVYNSNPTVTGCTFSGNNTTGENWACGGGMCNMWGSSPTVTDCVFSGQTSNHDAAGMFNSNSNSDPIVLNCMFTGNSATEDGGGMVNRLGSNPRVVGCTFNNNSAGWGGAMDNNCSNPTVVGCTFNKNAARRGGGMDNYDSDPTVVGCTFSGNHVTGRGGGGMWNFASSPTMISCVFTANTAATRGGGIGSDVYCSLTLVNCVFSGNQAGSGAGVLFWTYCDPTIVNCAFSGNQASDHGDGLYNETSTVTLVNCILWDGGEEIYNSAGTVAATHSCVQGGYDGVGNIDTDPLFVDPDGPDGDLSTWEDNDYRLGLRSPCVDAGDSTAVPPDSADLDDDGDTDEPTPFDLDGNPRFVDDPATPDGGTGVMPPVDMGAYEFQVMRASLDIRPGVCPNRLKVDGPGVLPMAVVGTAEFDVTQIDVESLVLRRADGVGGSLTPLMGPLGPMVRVEDVATPFEGEPCECHEREGDGIDDLSMKFDTKVVVAELQLNDLPDNVWGVWAELVVRGELLDGTRFSGTDCVSIVPPGPGSEPPDPGSASEPPEPGLDVGDEGPDSPPTGQPAVPDRDFSAGDSPQQDADADRRARSPASEPDDADADDGEDRRDASLVPFVGCGPVSPAFLLAAIAAIGLIRRS